jgi:hypothetical protein
MAYDNTTQEPIQNVINKLTTQLTGPSPAAGLGVGQPSAPNGSPGGFGMSPSGVPFRNEIEAWNDPARWVQSDLTTAIARGDTVKAGILTKNLAELKDQSNKNAENISKEKQSTITAEPAVMVATANNLPNPTGTKLLKDTVGVGLGIIGEKPATKDPWSLVKNADKWGKTFSTLK